MNLLALDIGTKRTGVALGETESGILVALETIKHRDQKELVKAVEKIIHEKKVTKLIVGLPRLPGGTEGSQAVYVRDIVKVIQMTCNIPVKFIDERFTSKGEGSDPDARAACAILETEMERIT